jgi:hypothetical protein
MFEHLKCANDEDVQYTYEEIVEEANRYNRWDNESNIPLVPRSTYKDSIPYERRLCNEIRQKFRIGHDDPNEPVIMKGAWEVMASKYSARVHFNDTVRERFLRFYKVTILSFKDAERWKEKLDTLMHKPTWKRSLYMHTNHEGKRISISQLYNIHLGTIWVFGIQYHLVRKEKLQVIKSIYRHVKKLTTLTNPNEEKDRWQRLIQQVI